MVLPITSMPLPLEAPPVAPLKLVTMTIRINLDTYLNLGVIAETIRLSDTIRSISYKNIKRVFDPVHGKSVVVKSADSGDQSERFKNQCTLDINVGDKVVNTKIFNNGKIINVGCLSVEHARRAVEIIIAEIWDNKASMTYGISSINDIPNHKKFFKDEIRKKYSSIIQLLILRLGLETDMGAFDPILNAEQALPAFLEHSEDIMFIYAVIYILKNYYDEKLFLDEIDSPIFQRMLDLIVSSRDGKGKTISNIFPVHIKQDRPAGTEVHIELINKSTNSGYYINRKALQEILGTYPEIKTIEYDKNRYPGVIVQYACTDKVTKIIFFNTGKINITAAHTHEQIDTVYAFIKKICTEHFDDLLLKSEYTNKIKEYEDSLPTKFEVGEVEGQQYYLLKKTSIMSNPRNLRILKKIGLIDKYKI